MNVLAETQLESPVTATAAGLALDGTDLLTRSSLYREYLAERDEILRHKWIESERAGCDIGFEQALIDWVLRHRANWRKARTIQRA